MASASFRRTLAELRGQVYEEPQAAAPATEQPRPLRVLERREADVCDVIGEDLRRRGWEVFYEVPLGRARPDVVGFKDDRTLAIEAKLRDVAGVVKQGLRIANLVDICYLALPEATANEAALEILRLQRRLEARGEKRVLPGVLIVGQHELTRLCPPSGQARRRVSAARLRAVAERYGAERGGVPSTDQMVRNGEIWRAWIGGASVPELAAGHALSPSSIRNLLSRLDVWREHVAACTNAPCLAADADRRDFFAGAHRHRAELLALPAAADRRR